MDPLSVSASVAGLLTATQEVAKLLRPYVSASRETPSIAAHVRDETESTRAILVGLQTLLLGLPTKVPPGGALVSISQAVAILTNGVRLFADLEGVVRGLVTSAPPASSDEGTAEKITDVWGVSSRLPLRARLRWARQEQSLKPLLERLQGFKVSVTTVLMLLQCESDRRAAELQADLAANVSALLENDREMSRRMMHLEDEFDIQTIRSRRRQSIASVITKTSLEVASTVPAKASLGDATQESTSTAAAVVTSSVPLTSENSVSTSYNMFRSVFEFENDLETSCVYRRVKRDTMDFSFRSSVQDLHAWSMLSACSLADVSVLSVIALPLDLADVANRYHYVDTIDQQLPYIVDTQSIPDPDPEPPFVGAIFDNCQRIYFQLVEIPGFQELFRVHSRSQGSDSEAFLHWEDDSAVVWHPRDVFGVLRSIFQEDSAYWLLANQLGWNLDVEDYHYSSHSTGQDSHKAVQRAISLFQQHYIHKGFKRHELFSADDALNREGRVGALKVLACVGKLLEHLVGAGTLPPMNEEDLDAPISRMKALNWLPDSVYKRALASFVEDHRLFVRDLLSLVSALEKASQRSSLLLADQPLISHQFLSQYADSEIGLLLTIESMLLASPRQHLWACTVRQWTVGANAHCAVVFLEEQNIKEALQSALYSLPHASQTIQDNQRLITSCLNLMPRLSQMFIRTIQFFQGTLGMLVAGSAGIGAISPAQKTDFLESQELVKDTLDFVNRRIGRQDRPLSIAPSAERDEDNSIELRVLPTIIENESVNA